MNLFHFETQATAMAAIAAALLFAPKSNFAEPKKRFQNPKAASYCIGSIQDLKPVAAVGLLGAGLTMIFVGNSSAVDLSSLNQLSEPSNALSLPTWAVHVSSVVEWITAMALVWQYGEKSEYDSWKGLSWGMVPLLGGALCACTYHFFYNAENLEVLVALQAALTVIGNITMCIAAFRIYKASKVSDNL